VSAAACSIAASSLGLAFVREPGPLVATVGLCGGAGASTVAHLLAASAARESRGAVLLAETTCVSGTLAQYAGARSRASLRDLARDLERDTAPAGPPFARADDGLRVLASGPAVDGVAVRAEAIEEVLWHARGAHVLTVVDCGSLTHGADLAALGCVTHVLWVVPATAAAVRRAGELLDVLDLALPGREVLVARHDASGRPAALQDLTDLARRREAVLALMPHVSDLGELPLRDRIEQTAVLLQALAGVIAR